MANEFKIKNGFFSEGSSNVTGSFLVTGDVGIGTTSPAYKLDVYATSSSDGIRVATGGTSKVILNGDGVVIWGPTADAGVLSWDTGKAIIKAQSGYALSLGANNTADQLYINTSGNVGIGTPSPQFKINLYSSTGSPNIIGTNDVFNNSPMVIGHGYDGTAYGPGYESLSNITAKIDFISDVFIGYVGDAIRFSTTPQQIIPIDSDTSTERMRISSDGNVGIGTTTPSNKLHVENANYSFIQSTATTYGSLVMGVSGPNGVIYTDSGIPLYLDPADELILRTNGGTEAARITTTQNMGIGTSTPDASAILDVTSTTQGFLPPRMTDSEMNAISSPAPGLIVWNTDSVQLFVFDGASWRKIAYG